MIVRRRKLDGLDTVPDHVSGASNPQLDGSPTAAPPGPGATPIGTAHPGRPASFPPDLIIEPISRRPLILPEATCRWVHDLRWGLTPARREQMPLPSDPPTDRAGAWGPCRLRLACGPVATYPFPRVSIVVITRDNLVLSKLCLESVLANTNYPDYELIVVDNGSGDELCSYLDQLAGRHPFIRVVHNETNRGFTVANNQGLSRATGDRFVLLNNDTIVPGGWLRRLVRHLDDPQVGAVGPVTNRIGNEAQIETSYRSYAEFERFARDCAQGHAGERFEIEMLAMFCFAMRREAHERVGPLDERYQIGMFEDDDYAVRLRAQGYRLICAEDVFVHHFGGASFGGLLPSAQFQELLRANRERFERKWGIAWQPHRRRPGPVYQQLIARIRDVVREVIPAGARVLVISKGDPDLLDLEGRVAQHFPQGPDGWYSGYHPAGSDDAINHLDSLHRGGAEFLLIPAPALWWLEHYAGFKQHLADVAEEAFREAGLCVIFRLSRSLQHPSHIKF
jgi:GT2 family glycosyltransferase